jgi:hypothetical protein
MWEWAPIKCSLQNGDNPTRMVVLARTTIQIVKSISDFGRLNSCRMGIGHLLETGTSHKVPAFITVVADPIRRRTGEPYIMFGSDILHDEVFRLRRGRNSSFIESCDRACSFTWTWYNNYMSYWSTRVLCVCHTVHLYALGILY